MSFYCATAKALQKCEVRSGVRDSDRSDTEGEIPVSPKAALAVVSASACSLLTMGSDECLSIPFGECVAK